MQNTLLYGGGGGGSGGSKTSTLLSKEGNADVVMSSEESSSYLEDSELELGLGLSLGGGGKTKGKPRPAAAGGDSWDQYARILTAKDFPPMVSARVSSSSSSSSSVTRANNNVSCGTKRTAEPSSPPGRSALSQVVGWPPVGNFRMNSIVNHAKAPLPEDRSSTVDKFKGKNSVGDETNYKGNINNNISPSEKAPPKTSLFAKVNMDGMAIGRKVDLNAHSCYKTLARTLDDMFRPSAAAGGRRLLDGSSDFVLTYEDREGDWMLVGDVPWEMFVSSVRRLRIMRTAEANGLAPRSQEKNRR